MASTRFETRKSSFSFELDTLRRESDLLLVRVWFGRELAFELSELAELIAALSDRGIVLVDGVFSRRLSG